MKRPRWAPSRRKKGSRRPRNERAGVWSRRGEERRAEQTRVFVCTGGHWGHDPDEKKQQQQPPHPHAHWSESESSSPLLLSFVVRSVCLSIHTPPSLQSSRRSPTHPPNPLCAILFTHPCKPRKDNGKARRGGLLIRLARAPPSSRPRSYAIDFPRVYSLPLAAADQNRPLSFTTLPTSSGHTRTIHVQTHPDSNRSPSPESLPPSLPPSTSRDILHDILHTTNPSMYSPPPRPPRPRPRPGPRRQGGRTRRPAPPHNAPGAAGPPAGARARPGAPPW